MQSYTVSVTYAPGPRERKSTVRTYLVVADDEEAAVLFTRQYVAGDDVPSRAKDAISSIKARRLGNGVGVLSLIGTTRS